VTRIYRGKVSRQFPVVWHVSDRAEPAAVAIADRHYNRQRPGTPQFVPPGRCLVLLADQALWVTSWPFPAYVKHDWPGAWINSLFRREGGSLASDMIRLAVAHTRWRWPDPPDRGMVTFIDPTKVRGTKVRGELVYGYSYLKAGFRAVGSTKSGLLAFQMLPVDMPSAIEPAGAQRALVLEAS
jgi:hypothetical protein